MKDIIINTPERFIGKHKDHRISIVFVNKFFYIDIQDKTNMNIMEMHGCFRDIKAAINFSVEYINQLNLK